MTEFNAARFTARLQNAETPAEVNKMFEEITSLSAPEQKAAIDAVEKEVVSSFTEEFSGPELSQLRLVFNALDRAKGTPQGDFVLAQVEAMLDVEVEDAEGGQAISQIFLNIHNLKGEDSAPFVKAYVDEASKLSDAEYNSSVGHMRLMLSAIDRVKAENKPKPPANPFRKGGAPTP